MLRLLYGRAGSGLVRNALARIAERPSQDAGLMHLVIVPRHFSHECERLLARELGDRASLMAEVLTMQRLSDRVFEEYGGACDQYLDEGGRLLVMSIAARKIAPLLRSLGGLVTRPDFLQGVIELVDELKRNRISPESLDADTDDRELADRLHDLSLLASAYEAELGRLRDPRDLYERLRDLLDESGYAAGRRVTVLGFTEFTEQEYAILSVLLRDTEQLTVALECGRDDGEDPELFFGQESSSERLRRICSAECIPFSEETLPRTLSATRPASLAALESGLFADGEVRVFPQPAPEIRVCRESTVWSECERAADEIISLCRERGFRLGEIAVAAPQDGDYRGALAAIFDARGIACYLDSTDDITHKPIISALISAVDMVLNGFAAADVQRFLGTGLSPLGFEESCALKNYISMWSIHGSAWSSGRAWTMNPGGFSAEDTEASAAALAAINRSREKVCAPFLRLISHIRRTAEYPARELTSAFYEFFTELGLEERIAEKQEEFERAGELQAADEYAQLWRLVCDVLDQFWNILGDATLDLTAYATLFKIVLGSISVGTIPPSLDCVAVGDAGRLRHRSPRALLLLGASAGQFPPAAVNNTLLSDRVRDELAGLGVKLEPAAARLNYRSLDVAYAALTLPGEYLYISWCGGADGSPRAPAFYVSRLISMFSLKTAEPSGEERLLSSRRPAFELALGALGGGDGKAAAAALEYFRAREDYAPLLDRALRAAARVREPLSHEAVVRLYGARPTLTASRVDRFQSCRYACFCQYGLKAKPMRSATLDAPESGTLLHYVLEHTVRDIVSGEGFENITNERAREIAAVHLAEYAADVLGGLENKSARVRFLFRRLGSTVMRLVDDIVEEMRVSQFRPLDFELSFSPDGDLPPVPIELEDGNLASLIGVVDRVDGWVRGDKLYLRVVDYKSGAKKFDLSDIWNGLGLQMLIYLFALRSEGRLRYNAETVGAGVLYLPVRDVTVSAKRGDSDERIAAEAGKKLARSGLLLAESEVVAAMDGSTEKRYVPAGFTVGGAFTRRSSVATLEQFGKLERYVAQTLAGIARELMRGELSAEPCVLHGRLVCEYCDYADICQFDRSNGADRVRYLRRVTSDEFWNGIDAENDGEAN